MSTESNETQWHADGKVKEAENARLLLQMNRSKKRVSRDEILSFLPTEKSKTIAIFFFFGMDVGVRNVKNSLGEMRATIDEKEAVRLADMHVDRFCQRIKVSSTHLWMSRK